MKGHGLWAGVILGLGKGYGRESGGLQKEGFGAQQEVSKNYEEGRVSRSPGQQTGSNNGLTGPH